MSISLDEVRNLAGLARLDLQESEILALQGELNALIGHFADVQNLDAEGAAAHVVALQNVWSEDRVGDCLPRDQAIHGAPVSKAGLFVVPTIIED